MKHSDTQRPEQIAGDAGQTAEYFLAEETPQISPSMEKVPLLNILSAIADPVAVLDRTGEIRFANTAMQEVLEMEAGSDLPDSLQSYIGETCWTKLAEQGFDSLSQQDVWHQPIQITGRSTNAFMADAQLVNIDGPHSHAGRYALIVKTRTNVVRSVHPVKRNKPNYRVRSLQQSMPMVVVLNAQGQIRDVNQVSLNMMMLEKPDLIGALFWQLPIWDRNQNFETDSRAGLAAAVEGRVERNLAGLTDAGGRHIWIELSYTPIPNVSESTGNILVEGRDVTARIEAESSQRKYTEKLGKLSRELIRAQENERRRIAQELHDEIGQSLTALRLSLHNVRGSLKVESDSKRIGACMQVVDQVLKQIRSLSLDLWPTMLDDLGLVAALGWFISRQAELTGLDIELDTQLSGSRWAKSIEIACFRIAQEAISNAMRYSKSQRIVVTIQVEGHELLLKVQDFGRGFDMDGELEHAAEGNSLGLVGMQQRAELANGKFIVESARDCGTSVVVRFPIDQKGIFREFN